MMKKSIILLFVLFLIPFVSAVENINEEYSVDDNTLALWHFNEGEGNTAYDETNNENDGTITGATWTEGKYGNGLVFDGNNDLISVPYQRVLIPEHLTLEAWVKKSSNARGSVISKNGPYYLGFINEDNKIRGAVYINNVGWVEVDGETELELDTWYHIAMTYDGENVKVYVNGVEDGTTERTGNILITGQALYIGWGEPGVNFYFNGTIDEVRISNIARDYSGEEEENELEYHIMFQATGERVILNTKNINNNLINNTLFYYNNNLERIRLGEDIDKPFVVENGFSVTNNSMGE